MLNLYFPHETISWGEANLVGLITPVTASEISQALKRMRNNRTCAEDGLVAEMLKHANGELVEAIATYFTDILSSRLEPPAEWKVARLSVIFKKGDASEPRNDRPISIIPVMAKLYSIVLYTRMRDSLDALLTEEQYGFRRGRGCDDVNHILRMVVEKANEWGEELWMATLDVEKAFDKALHSELFAALLNGGIDMSIVASLRKLYRGMEAYVQLWPGLESRRFEIQRGVRQGDPLSPVLFNLVLTGVLKDVDSVWQRRGYGTNVGQTANGQRVTHVAFADDMTLIASSWTSLKRMVILLPESLQRRGLELHPSKCKAQTNCISWSCRGNIQILPDFALNVLHETACLEVLGTSLSLLDTTASEIDHRIAVGWSKFWALKRLLLNRNVSIKKRLQLFDSTVGSSILYGSHAWTPRTGEMRKVHSAEPNATQNLRSEPAAR